MKHRIAPTQGPAFEDVFRALTPEALEVFYNALVVVSENPGYTWNAPLQKHLIAARLACKALKAAVDGGVRTVKLVVPSDIRT